MHVYAGARERTYLPALGACRRARGHRRPPAREVHPIRRDRNAGVLTEQQRALRGDVGHRVVVACDERALGELAVQPFHARERARAAKRCVLGDLLAAALPEAAVCACPG